MAGIQPYEMCRFAAENLNVMARLSQYLRKMFPGCVTAARRVLEQCFRLGLGEKNTY